MTTNYDSRLGDGSNTVYQTSSNYATGTVSIQVNDRNYDTFEELGENFILFKTIPEKDAVINITYTIAGTLPNQSKEEYDIKKRLVELERLVLELHQSNILLKQAIDNRVSVSAFEAWITLMEKKTGINLVDTPFGYVGKELYLSSKVYK